MSGIVFHHPPPPSLVFLFLPPTPPVAAQLLLEYVLSIAACARAATAYGGALLGLAPGAGLIHVGRLVSLDPAAAALVLALAALLARGTAQSASVNATVTLVSLFAALYVLAAGAPSRRPPT